MRPPMKKINFKVGDKVEVMSSEEGFYGSFYEATIVSCLDTGHYVVRFKNLLDDNDESKPLTETRLPKELRPLPPRVRVPEFECNEMVDAFDNDGWWMGKITMKFPGEKKGTWKYRVFFHTTNDELWYAGNRIRVHHEWISGEWQVL